MRKTMAIIIIIIIIIMIIIIMKSRPVSPQSHCISPSSPGRQKCQKANMIEGKIQERQEVSNMIP